MCVMIFVSTGKWKVKNPTFCKNGAIINNMAIMHNVKLRQRALATEICLEGRIIGGSQLWIALRVTDMSQV